MGKVFHVAELFEQRQGAAVRQRVMLESRTYLNETREREAYIEKRIVELKREMDAPLRDYLLKIAPLAKRKTSLTVVEMLRYGGFETHEYYEVAVTFMREHGPEVFEAATLYQIGLRKLHGETLTWQPSAATRKLDYAIREAVSWISVLSGIEAHATLNVPTQKGNT